VLYCYIVVLLYCLLFIVYCLLFIAYCLLLIVYCLDGLEQRKNLLIYSFTVNALHHSAKKKSSRCKKGEDFFFNCIKLVYHLSTSS
jgi:hypothetical protein